ncbi:hypothetical protein J6590_050101 [Homalodisca vitripennis]|nr:hypothetical protein J6590_050101 [Homalodisca vitripennis]
MEYELLQKDMYVVCDDKWFPDYKVVPYSSALPFHYPYTGTVYSRRSLGDEIKTNISTTCPLIERIARTGASHRFIVKQSETIYRFLSNRVTRSPALGGHDHPAFENYVKCPAFRRTLNSSFYGFASGHPVQSVKVKSSRTEHKAKCKWYYRGPPVRCLTTDNVQLARFPPRDVTGRRGNRGQVRGGQQTPLVITLSHTGRPGHRNRAFGCVWLCPLATFNTGCFPRLRKLLVKMNYISNADARVYLVATKKKLCQKCIFTGMVLVQKATTNKPFYVVDTRKRAQTMTRLTCSEKFTGHWLPVTGYATTSVTVRRVGQPQQDCSMSTGSMIDEFTSRPPYPSPPWRSLTDHLILVSSRRTTPRATPEAISPELCSPSGILRHYCKGALKKHILLSGRAGRRETKGGRGGAGGYCNGRIQLSSHRPRAAHSPLPHCGHVVIVDGTCTRPGSAVRRRQHADGIMGF